MHRVSILACFVVISLGLAPAAPNSSDHGSVKASGAKGVAVTSASTTGKARSGAYASRVTSARSTLIPRVYNKGDEFTCHVWLFDHYVPMPGKYLGVWPGGVDTNLIRLRNQYGFSGVYDYNGDLGLSYQIGIFGAANVMKGLWISAGQAAISVYSNMGLTKFYIDEPAQHSYWVSQMQDLDAAVHACGGTLYSADNVMPGTLIYGTNQLLVDVLNKVDHVGTDQYRCVYDGIIVRNCDDAIQDDNDYRSAFGSKMEFIWTDIKMDEGCWSNKLAWCNSNGVNQVWVYCAGGSGCTNDGVPLDWTKMDGFAIAAFQNYWLQQVDQEYTLYWRCMQDNTMISPGCVDNEKDIYIDGVLTWEWDGKEPTGQYETYSY